MSVHILSASHPRYIVVTPPRSRSAWLATFLTYHNSYCFHEVIPEVANIRELPAFFNRVDFPHVGTVDNGAAHFSKKLLETFDERACKFVVIRRREAEVFKALADINLPTTVEYVKGITAGMDNIMAARPSSLELDYAELKKDETWEKIWTYCIAPVPESRRWPFEMRVEQLKRTSIVLDLESENTRLERLFPNVESLFRDDCDDRLEGA